MYNLTWIQAQEAMREGKRVKNSNFTDEEFFYMVDGKIWDEQGYPMAGWYRGYDWQDEGWMIIDEMQQCLDEVKEIVKKHNVVVVDNFSALEDKVVAHCARQDYSAETVDYFAWNITPQTYPMPREKQNYNFRIMKGRGHNKLQKRKKK